jgi:hypothetical protein
MKKFLAIAMFSVYTLLSVGVQMHLHYCCGKLADIHLFSDNDCSHHDDNQQDSCALKSDCCSFIDINLKVDDSHEQTSPIHFSSPPIVHVLPEAIEVFASLNDATAAPISDPINPPDLRRYLLFHALVLYA